MGYPKEYNSAKYLGIHHEITELQLYLIDDEYKGPLRFKYESKSGARHVMRLLYEYQVMRTRELAKAIDAASSRPDGWEELARIKQSVLPRFSIFLKEGTKGGDDDVAELVIQKVGLVRISRDIVTPEHEAISVVAQKFDQKNS